MKFSKVNLLIGIGLVASLLIGRKVYVDAFGLRHNNPGNIVYNPANDWIGQTGFAEAADGIKYAVFSEMKWGVRAMGKNLDSYRRGGVVTLRQIIARWRTGDQLDRSHLTESYIDSVEQSTGWQESFVPVREEGDYVALVKAITKHENGLIPPTFTNKFIADSLVL